MGCGFVLVCMCAVLVFICAVFVFMCAVMSRGVLFTVLLCLFFLLWRTVAGFAYKFVCVCVCVCLLFVQPTCCV